MRKIALLLMALGLFSFKGFTPLDKSGSNVLIRLNNNDASEVTIKVTTKEGYVVYQESTNEKEVGKKLNFGSAKKNTYLVEVMDDGEKYTETIEVR